MLLVFDRISNLIFNIFFGSNTSHMANLACNVFSSPTLPLKFIPKNDLPSLTLTHGQTRSRTEPGFLFIPG